MATIKVLCIHGVGRNPPGDSSWQQVWRDSVATGLASQAGAPNPEFRFVEHDPLFERDPPDTATYLRAVAELLAGRFGFGRDAALAARSRDFSLRWTAGMVAQWVTDEQLRQATRELLLSQIEDFRPNLIIGHSLGSLIAYDTLRIHRDSAVVKRANLITSGSQVGNPFVLNELGGRIAELPVKSWFHLYNPKDRVFAAPLRVEADNFEQVEAEFGSFFGANHSLSEYLTHPNVIAGAWPQIAGTEPVRGLRVSSAGHVVPAKRVPNRRALLVGINEYPDAEVRLAGCVNDAYRLSATLQECGFEPDEIRLLLNERATAQGIRERLAWLLDDVRDGDVRLFSYSGHGAQIPVYGPNQEPDGYDECLVPVDFDWSDPTSLLLDDWISDLYSQLPYDSHFVMFLDCCHSGGLTRGGGPKIRTVAPPDDVRHRALRWEADLQMWVPRDFKPLIPDDDVQDYTGTDRATRRFGRSVSLRRHGDSKYDELRKEYGHDGPYLPIILQACQEHEVAFEYEDGATSYGAFTFCATKLLRNLAQSKGKPPTFDQLCQATAELLENIGYQQEPAIVGPQHLREATIPLLRRAPDKKRSGQSRAPRKKRPAKKKSK